jgi:phospholipid-binding lipoprotein MlaA
MLALTWTLALALLGGCATVGDNATPGQKADPFEGWNRKVYAFNESVDAAVLKPVAETYRDVVPQLVRTGVDNVLGNISDVWSAANQVLQGKFQTGVEMGMRVLTNTVFGLGGLLDPATEVGLTRRAEDFGQTLGVWGVGNGPFIMLPLLGPSTLRDTGGLVVDRQTAPSSLPAKAGEQVAVAALEVVSLRTSLLSATDLLDQIALDKYSFTRDAYLARRRDQLFDGAPPLDIFDDEDYGDEAPAAPAIPAAAAAAAPAWSVAKTRAAPGPAGAGPAAVPDRRPGNREPMPGGKGQP